MPSNNCHIQTANCLLIAVPLSATCTIVTATPTFVTAGIGSVTVEKERQEGTDYSAPNFGGATCGPQQVGETVEKWGNATGEICLLDWAFQSATSGNPTVLDATGNVIGYQELKQSVEGVCTPSTRPRLGVVIVRKAAQGEGGCVAASATGGTGAVAHFFSNMTDFYWDIPPFEDARAVVPFTAKAYANPAVIAGPLNLWPAPALPNKVDPASFHSQVFIDPAVLPSPSCDTPVSHPAPAVRA